MGNGRYGEINFGPEGQVDLNALQIRWFDYWLKGKANGVDHDPKARSSSWAPTAGATKPSGRLSRAQAA